MGPAASSHSDFQIKRVRSEALLTNVEKELVQLWRKVGGEMVDAFLRLVDLERKLKLRESFAIHGKLLIIDLTTPS